MTKPVKFSLGIAVAFLLILVVLLIGSAAEKDEPTEPVVAGESRLVRADSHIIGEPGTTGVTLVEFLDFECPACAAAQPAVEQLRKDYAGRVTFVVRQFPLSGHYNADRAARAVEAAAEQGEFEAMYQRLYETQQEWGGQQVPHGDLFRTFANDLDLNLEAYDEAYDSNATTERIERDQSDGIALGVQGTPTFFVGGEHVEVLSYQDLTAALDEALKNTTPTP